MENRISELEKKIAEIQNRNLRVEADKAWETSMFRAASIIVITYIATVVILYVIDFERIWLNALVSTIGFILSIQTLPIIKRWWIKKHLRNGSGKTTRTI